jgi:hypothetical protein
VAPSSHKNILYNFPEPISSISKRAAENTSQPLVAVYRASSAGTTLPPLCWTDDQHSILREATGSKKEEQKPGKPLGAVDTASGLARAAPHLFVAAHDALIRRPAGVRHPLTKPTRSALPASAAFLSLPAPCSDNKATRNANHLPSWCHRCDIAAGHFSVYPLLSVSTPCPGAEPGVG